MFEELFMTDLSFLRGDHYALFGDGTTSQIADKRQFVDDAGVKKWVFLLWPGSRQKALYNFAEDPLNRDYDEGNDILRREFDDNDVEVVEQNPRFTRIWIRRTLDNRPTALTEREAHLTEKIKYLEKEVSSLKATLAKAQEDLHKSRVLTQEAVKDWVEIIKVAGEANSKPKTEAEMLEESFGAGGQ